MSESLYDFRAALSGEPEVPAEGGEQAELFTDPSSRQTGPSSGSGGAPFSLNLANGLLLIANGSGTVEVDTAEERVVIDPDSPGSVQQRDGDLVLGATAEGTPPVAARTVRGEVLGAPREGVPAPEGESSEGSAADVSSTPSEAPVHVVSVRPAERADLVEAAPASEGTPVFPLETARLSPVMAGIPAVDAEPVSAPIEAVPDNAHAGEPGGEAAGAVGPVVTVDPETGETAILAEDLRITVGPEDGLVRIEPSEENVPLAPDADPITINADGLTVVVDPATGTLEVEPVRDGFTDVTVEIGGLRIVMDGETGEVSIDPGEGTVVVDPETGLVTVEPVEDDGSEDGDRSAGDDGGDTQDRPGGDGEGGENGRGHSSEGEEGGEGGEEGGDRPAGDEKDVAGGEDHEGGDGRYRPDDRPSEDEKDGDPAGEGRERPTGEGNEAPIRSGQNSEDGSGTVPGGTATPVGPHTDGEGPEESDRSEPYSPKESADGPYASAVRVPGDLLPKEDGAGHGGGEEGAEDTDGEGGTVSSPEGGPGSDGDSTVPDPRPTGGTTGGSGSGESEEDKKDEGDKRDKGDGENKNKKESGGEEDGGEGGTNGGGEGGSSDKGTKIDLAQMEAFKNEFIVKVREKLDEHTPDYYAYNSSSGNSESASRVTLIGNDSLLKNAELLAKKIDKSMSSLYSIMTEFQKDFREIQNRIDANIKTFRELEEDQALSAAQVSYLMDGQRSSGGMTI